MQKSKYVGIGVSTGGLVTLKKLLALLPTQENITYFIAQHLDVNTKSHLEEILSPYTKIPLHTMQVRETFAVNSINIIPPGYNLFCENGTLVLEKNSLAQHLPTPSADKLFEALAMCKKQDSIGIVLTGTGHDGSSGIEEIKRYGGKTLAQSPMEALYQDMPQNAIDTGFIDDVLSIKQIAYELKLIAQQSIKPLAQITKLLREKEHFNIEKYKEETISRRLERRMMLTDSKDIHQYLEYLKKHEEELHILRQSLLIGVTEFFRDAKAFDGLKKELLQYLADKPKQYNFRASCIACSTGEEAYSLGIILAETKEELHKEFEVTIFATDINDTALSIARKGFYAHKSFDGMDKQRLEKYFIALEDGYKANDTLRSQIIFSHHDILSDQPFLKQDLIICRNFMIYINADIQTELFKIFYHSLKEDGLLFLGSSETALLSAEYFREIAAQSKIYKRQKIKKPFNIPSRYLSKQLQTQYNQPSLQKSSTKLPQIESEITHTMFEILSSKTIVVNPNFSIVYKQGDFPFLEIPDGFVTLNVIENLHQALRYDVTKLLNKVLKSHTTQSTKFIELDVQNQQKIFVRVTASWLKEKKEDSFILLYFEDLNPEQLQFNAQRHYIADESEVIKNLTAQITTLKEDNTHILKEVASSKENMQLLYEELQSANEELQSSNEELETSNEELQSSNEELHLSIANEQKLQRNLSLILESTYDGIIGLDKKGKHTFVNNAALQILGYKEEELLGKEAHHTWHHTKANGENYPLKECTLHYHLSRGKKLQQKDTFWTKNGQAVQVQVFQNPIIEDGKTIGAVVSFHDITKENRLTHELYLQENLYRLTFEEADIGIAHTSLDGHFKDANKYLCNLLGYTNEEFLKLTVAQVTHPQDQDTDKEMLQNLQNGLQASYHIEKRYIHKNGDTVWVNLAVVLLKDAFGKPLYFLKIIRDITQLKLLMYQLEVEKNKFQNILEFTPIPIMLYSQDKGHILFINQNFEETTGYTLEEVSNIDSLVEKLFSKGAPTSQEAMRTYFENPLATKQFEQSFQTKENKHRVTVLNAVRLEDANIVETNLYLIAMIDITEIQKKDELLIAQSRQAAMGDMLAMIAHQWRQPLSVISMVSNNIQAQIALEDKIDSPSLKNFITTINEQTQYLSHTIDDFRNFFKPDKQKEHMSLHELIKKLKHLVDKALQDNNIRLEYTQTKDIKLYTYQNQLLQVLLNIVNNAKDAIKEKNVSDAHIVISAQESKGKLLLRICDNGGGIDPQVIDKLGEPYVTTKSKNGTGLGLYMSKIILAKHLNGTLSWSSNNKETCFTVSLQI
ncbi:PAS domain S-box protein [Sulfurimonas sp.]|uniref:PAS domain S-box protein n=1 Tax=Sulfurimonas sp. TaxID=2022749 RepID=UPI00262CFB75|nr:PAS domain S-box protein [Sulfurimonas sp.]